MSKRKADDARPARSSQGKRYRRCGGAGEFGGSSLVAAAAFCCELEVRSSGGFRGGQFAVISKLLLPCAVRACGGR